MKFGILNSAALSAHRVALLSPIAIAAFLASNAWAAKTPPVTAPPPLKLPPLESAWDGLTLRIDVRNLTGPNNAGAIPEQAMLDRVKDANTYWKQCAIQFIARSTGNASAFELKVPYEPRSQEDLSAIDQALKPRMDGALPLTIAGPWNFVDRHTGMILFGLGWYQLDQRSGSLLRAGAMIAANRLREVWVGQLVGHEIGHALSLPHSGEGDNLMAGGIRLKREQCEQARGFAKHALKGMMTGATRLTAN